MPSLNARTQTLGDACNIQGIDLDAGTQVVFGLSDELVLCILPNAQSIFGFPCAAGPVHFHPDGQLARFTLSTEYLLGTFLLPAGTQIFLNDDKSMCARLGNDLRVGPQMSLEAGTALHLNAQGELLSFCKRLAQEIEIGGYFCEAGTVATWMADGRPERLTLSRNQRVDGIPCMEGTDVEFHPNGHLAHATLGEAFSFGDITLEAGTTLTFSANGTISVAHIVEDLVLDDRIIPDGSTLFFNDEGEFSHYDELSWAVTRVAQG